MPTDTRKKLSSSVARFTGRYSPAIITLLVMSGIFYFYFNVIVNENDGNLKKRNFRGLTRIADNLAKKIESYAITNGTNFINAIKTAKDDSARISFVESQYGLTKSKPDTSIKSDSSFFIKFNNGWQLLFKNKDSSFSDTSGTLASAGIEKFIAPLLRRDLFKHYFLAVGDTILMDELIISHKRLSEYLNDRSTIDSVKKGPIIQSGQIWKIESGGKEYRLFLLPFIVAGQFKFSLGGYMPVDDYISEQRYIPVYGIIWPTIGILLVILMFPLLKVFFMHRSEFLRATNALSSIASLHVLASVLIFLALNTYAYFSIVRPTLDGKLKNLAHNIDTVFNAETTAALRIMDSAHLGLEMLAKRNLPLKDSTHYKISDYPYLMNIVWTEPSGQQKIRWTTKNYPPENINISDRDYFLAVKNNNLWLRENDEKAFYLTGVYSRVESKNLVVISRPVKTNDRGGMTGTLKLFDGNKDSLTLLMINAGIPFRSLFNAVLPPKTGFCLMKENGDVLFHSDATRNLNENLVEECDNNQVLLSLLYARREGYFGSRYAASTQRFFIHPVKGMPYYIVTFMDMKTLWSEDLDVISVSSILILMNLFIILLPVLIIQILRYRNTLLQHKSTLFTWLRPNRNLASEYALAKYVYWTAAALQVLFIFLYKDNDQLCLAGIIFSYSFFLMIYAYYRFAIQHQKKQEEEVQVSELTFWVPFGIYVLADIIFCLYLFNAGHGALFFAASQMPPLLLVIFFITKKGSHEIPHKESDAVISKKTDVINNSNNYRSLYTSSILAFIIATGVVPSVLFYCMSFKQERLLSLKYKQLDFANQILNQQPQPEEEIPGKDSSFRLTYHTPFYFGGFADTVKICKSDPAKQNAANNFEQLYWRIKPSFSMYSAKMEFLEDGDKQINDFTWGYPDRVNQRLYYQVPRTHTYADSSRAFSINSQLESGMGKIRKAIKENLGSFLVLLIILTSLGLGFFYLLKNLINKVFFDGYFDAHYFTEFDDHLSESLPPGKNLFVNGLIKSGKYSVVRNHCVNSKEKSKKNIIDKDISELKDITIMEVKGNQQEKSTENFQPELKLNRAVIPDPGIKNGSTNSKKTVLVRHFEMFSNDAAKTEAKLQLLEGLLRDKYERIIIFSSRSFECLLNTRPKNGKGEMIDFRERWTNVMNKFYTVYYQWKKPGTSSLEKTNVIKNESLTADKIISDLNQYCNSQINDKIKEHVKTERSNNETQANSVKKKNSSEETCEYSKNQMDLLFKKLEDEFSYSEFLWGLREPLLRYIIDKKSTCFHFDFKNGKRSHMKKVIRHHFTDLYEKSCLKIQSMASNYYLATWQSLTLDEQRTLYDITIDEMVNPANRDIAARLTKLGLVKQLEDATGYQVRGKSFREFIFTQTDKKALVNLRADEASKGSWSNLQLPALIIVITMGIFLFTVQKDAFTNLLTYLGAALAGIGALLRVLGMIPSAK